jgi:Holliday junction resolvasome RuvABC endonuclease subunit
MIVGIDPGKRGGTGLCLIEIAPRRGILKSWTHTGDAKEIVYWVQCHRPITEVPVAVEVMTAMGAWKGSGSSASLENAQFVGEIIGRLETAGFTVIEVTKREALNAIGCKGKAPASRVRRCVEALFGSTKGMSSHAVDAAAAAWAAKTKLRKEQGTVIRIEARKGGTT